MLTDAFVSDFFWLLVRVFFHRFIIRYLSAHFAVLWLLRVVLCTMS
jgi:hypothetical protein